MKPKLLTITFLAILFSACQSQNQNTMIDKSTIENFDLNRYLGTWYELARFDHSFERGLEGVTATYSLRNDGKIKVLNQGYKGSLTGKHSVATGKAKLNSNGKPGQLKVSFFLFFYADYYILHLDPDYQWAIIGSSSDNYLWILSRTPVVTPEAKSKFIQLAMDRGYPVEKLIWVKHGSEK